MLAIPGASFLCLLLALAPAACSRRRPPPQATSTAAPPALDGGAGAEATGEADTPLAACQRACSDGANRKQIAAFERCDAEARPAARDACRQKALADTDGERAACRGACQGKHGDARDR